MTARKTFVTSILYLFFCLPLVMGQIGIKAGPSISDIAFVNDGQRPYLGYEANSLEHNLPVLTFQAGVFSTIDITKRWNLQAELLFARQGLNYSDEYLYDNITYQININYLQLPILLKYKTAIRKEKNSGVYAGPYVSWKLNAVRITEVEGQREKTKMQNVRNADVGIMSGYTFDIGLPSNPWAIDLGLSFSLVNMMDRVEGYLPWYYGPEKEYARNATIFLNLEYRF